MQHGMPLVLEKVDSVDRIKVSLKNWMKNLDVVLDLMQSCRST